jgi:hypothetical protein
MKTTILQLLRSIAQAFLVFQMSRILAKFRSDAAAEEQAAPFANPGAIGATFASGRIDM